MGITIKKLNIFLSNVSRITGRFLIIIQNERYKCIELNEEVKLKFLESGLIDNTRDNFEDERFNQFVAVKLFRDRSKQITNYSNLIEGCTIFKEVIDTLIEKFGTEEITYILQCINQLFLFYRSKNPNICLLLGDIENINKNASILNELISGLDSDSLRRLIEVGTLNNKVKEFGSVERINDFIKQKNVLNVSYRELIINSALISKVLEIESDLTNNGDVLRLLNDAKKAYFPGANISEILSFFDEELRIKQKKAEGTIDYSLKSSNFSILKMVEDQITKDEMENQENEF
jgi:hypothetical protein